MENLINVLWILAEVVVYMGAMVLVITAVDRIRSDR